MQLIALEPVISAEIMQLHHQKHHQTYVTNYNVAAEKLAEAVVKSEVFSSKVLGYIICNEISYRALMNSQV